MTPPVIQRWTEFVENGSADELDTLLAEDAVFFSPVVFTPQEGRAKVSAYLRAAAEMFGDTDFHYMEQWCNDQSAILEFAATIHGVYVNGIDMIHWNDDGRIVAFKVMLRPLKAIQTIMPLMAELLQRQAYEG